MASQILPQNKSMRMRVETVAIKIECKGEEMTRRLRFRTPRLGFTLIELLVVIGIIGILTTMLLPAVQMVREAGRRTTCSNQVRQLSLALMSYESTHGHLPVGVSNNRPYFLMTWITRTLPFMEQSSVWNQAIEDYQQHDPFVFVPQLHRGLSTVLPLLGCPSDPVSGQAHWTHQDHFVACTNYLGISGTNHTTRDGVFTYGRPTFLAEITDGQSNTLMIGERPPSADFWYGGWYASGTMLDVTLGVAEVNPSLSHLENCPPGPYRFGPGRNEQCDTLHFWSYHPSGAHFGLADGSVHLIPYSIDEATMQALGTKSAGETVLFEF